MKLVEQIRIEIIQQLYPKHTCNELAKRTGLSRKTIYNYINTGKATIDTLSKLCELTNIKIITNEKP
jgi:DNA-binding phage protein